jgi:hypothetical protein
MDHPSTTTATVDQAEADEDILTYTVSDEALEAAAGARAETTAHVVRNPITFWRPPLLVTIGCCG